MDEFDKEVAKIQSANPSEVNGNLREYFNLFQRPNGTYKIIWEKNVSTHIRHKVEKLLKVHFAPAKI